MKVLWLELTEPAAYVSEKAPIGGWQDSLERIVKTIPEIELYIAFISSKCLEVKVIDGVTYIPIPFRMNFWERHFKIYWDVYVKKVLPAAKTKLEIYKPDLIHIFGTEWPLGQIAAFTDIPVVIHIQGAIVPYNNASFPPGYSVCDRMRWCGLNPQKLFALWRDEKGKEIREQWERKTWKMVKNYMGRTGWDRALSEIMHPGRIYYHVEEALRPSFFDGQKRWAGYDNDKLRLITIGCASLKKGPDTILKVARILITLKVDFEWNVVGLMPLDIKDFVERKEKIHFNECHINILGLVKPEQLSDMLCSSSVYVHTAYIDNSPNSICEAQCIGVPIVSTNVGGISSLIRDGIDGILVPANDPWQMASAILQLDGDKEKMKQMSTHSSVFARKRHADENIRNQLLLTYKAILYNLV